MYISEKEQKDLSEEPISKVEKTYNDIWSLIRIAYIIISLSMIALSISSAYEFFVR